MTQLEFIEKIAPLCQKYAKQYGYKFASPAIAQACLESAYGTSTKAQHYNYFGLKYRPGRINCNTGYFEDGGSEQNKNGSYTLLPSTTAWYNFDNMEKGVEGYYQFLNIANYKRVKEVSSPLEYLQEIKIAGYATSLNYVQNVYSVIEKWNLTKYDTIEKKTITNSNLNIKKLTSINKTTIKNNRKIEWIVLHYTAGTKSTKGAAANVANYFKTSSVQASADFIVDDEEIVQYNGDLENRYCWAVGGKQYPSKSTSLAAKYYSTCGNINSISIEMCSIKTNKTTLNVSDLDWGLTETTINNAVKLTQYLMDKYNIDKNHVIMHHMVTGKLCPQPWCLNESRLIGWQNFLNKICGPQVQQISTPVQVPAPAAAYLVKINTDVLNVRKGPGTNYPIVTQVKRGSVYTIVAEELGWGKLKSGIGYIKLSYTKKV